jgi:hypothetical protein
MTEPAHFGRCITKAADFFAFPRTGSHFMFHAFTGLFDLVFLDNRYLKVREAITRNDELDPTILYALTLREEGVPYQPIWINPLATGVHGLPAKGEAKVLTLIREPKATIYSWFRLHRDRLKSDIRDVHVWVEEQFQRYFEFYTTGFDLIERFHSDVHLIRFEDVVVSPEVFQRICDFLSIQPKMNCAFVHWLLDFERVARRDIERTFYRSGRNDAWKEDDFWTKIVSGVRLPDFSRFGY